MGCSTAEEGGAVVALLCHMRLAGAKERGWDHKGLQREKAIGNFTRRSSYFQWLPLLLHQEGFMHSGCPGFLPLLLFVTKRKEALSLAELLVGNSIWDTIK